MLRNLVLLTGLSLSASAIAPSAQSTTVQSLLNEGYAVAGVIPSPAGPGVFLRKGTALVVCFVAEKPESPTVATRYCKPVK